ncbi:MULTISPECIES: STAS-like domain-containing protein [Gammaproteobacteria]|uniref:STAS-like domain-containing protein n=1 Tax=Gammaproteobacteria TaxID=1236 RepID=UPI001ADA9935|nr:MULTISPECIES: STAS-like domain-containing protein [Gammaproteobacteria]MBO9482237.1 STAS-like domain-containing protein [Salinisphaera sp. G21_0]MBO9497225.1 STAS-like domain-containing protein [Thalassotalea sp. G20_0]
MSEKIAEFDIGIDFNAFPGGRFIADGPASGEEFRDQHLARLVAENDKVVIYFDNAMGYGSSFLEEAFGGLVRKKIIAREELLKKLDLRTEQDSVKNSVIEYIKKA